MYQKLSRVFLSGGGEPTVRPFVLRGGVTRPFGPARPETGDKRQKMKYMEVVQIKYTQTTTL